jgi:multidrug efflux pump subunit AcrA (membrane-fusion protein)
MTQQPNPNAQHASEDYGSAPEQNPLSPRKVVFGAVLVLLIFAAIAAFGILRRTHGDTVLAQRTVELAPPTVDVAPAKPGAPTETLVLPGNVTAFTDSPIYARTDGYLQHWYYDIGAKVKQGALLAVIQTPELDKQVAQAQSDLATAQANANIARIQAERYSNLVKSDAVSQQDTDTFVSQAASTASAVKSSEANLQRLKELQSFEEVYAPFDGVVTHQLRSRRRNSALPHAGCRNASCLHQRARALFANPQARHEDRPHLSRASRENVPGHAGAYRRCHRSSQPHPSCRN